MISPAIDEVSQWGNVIAISPHLDDAVLSCGGTLSACSRRARPEVITVFAGEWLGELSPAAATFHAMWNSEGAITTVRRAEDTAAVSLLGGGPIHWEELDAIYRKKDGGDWLVADSDTSKPEVRSIPEPEMSRRISSRIEAVLSERKNGVVLAPAAIGAHIDHHRTRDATIEAVRKTAGNWRLLLWDDMPYVTHHGRVSPPLPSGVSLSEYIDLEVDRGDWARRIASVGMYASQLSMMSDGGLTLPEQIDRWATRSSRNNPVESFREIRYLPASLEPGTGMRQILASGPDKTT